MCECGCSSNFLEYTLPAPNNKLYLLTICQVCVSCDAGLGFSIELIDKANCLFKEYKSGEMGDGPLHLEDWQSSRGSLGASVIMGLRKHEFVNAVKHHLVGIDPRQISKADKIDVFAAEVIAEEMYQDAQARPKVLYQPEVSA